MNTTVFAYTEPGQSNPAFVNITEKPEGLVLYARARGANAPVEVPLTERELGRLLGVLANRRRNKRAAEMREALNEAAGA